MLCICCGQLAVHLHHVTRRSDIKRAARENGWDYHALAEDHRNLVPMAQLCHMNHHAHSAPLRLAVLPPCAFAFCREVLGAGPAANYLARHYVGSHPLLDAMYDEYEREAAA